MSLPEHRILSPYDQMKQDRRRYNIMWKSDIEEPEKTYDNHRIICNAVYIPWHSPEDLHCPICGLPKPKPIPVESKDESRKQKKPPIKGRKKTFIMSKDRNKKGKSQEQIELEKDIGHEVSSYEEFAIIG